MKKPENRSTRTQTRVATETTAQSQSAGGFSTLEPMEEKVIRMLHGLGEADQSLLEFAVGASEDARQRLVLMEAHNVADLSGDVPLSADASDELVQDIVARFTDRDA